MTQWADQFNDLPQPHNNVSVAVVGAGIGGLTAAYLLAKRGFKVSVFEAAERIGGRVYTDYDTFQPMFSEKGGEWIDSTHHQIIALAHELGLDVQDVTKKRTGGDLYYFAGKYYGNKDFINHTSGTGAYVAMAEYINRDEDKAKRDTVHSELLDHITMDDYLAQAQAATGTPQWVVDSIKMAYLCEFGMETGDQSALLLVRQIGTSKNRPFEVYGAQQDESRRIKGGNAKLIEALKNKLDEMGVSFHSKHTLKSIDYVKIAPHPVYLTFDTDGASKRMGFDYTISAIPFSKLREVDGLTKLNQEHHLSDTKLRAIRELGYGNIVKVTLGMNGRPWRNIAHFPEEANGSFRTDLPYLQNTWVTSVGQKDERLRGENLDEKKSLMTVLISGKEANDSIGKIVKGCKAGLSELFKVPEEQLFTGRVSFHRWEDHQFSKGSYSCFGPGQYTHIRPHCGTPELDGRLGFVGEHADPELYGYMNGAVHTALCEAKRIEFDRRKASPGFMASRFGQKKDFGPA